MIKKIFKKMDYALIAIVVVLFFIGIIALYSANGGIDGDTSECFKQVIWFLGGIIIAFFIVMIDYNILGKLWIPLYAIILLSLVAVLFTEPINGASSWFKIGDFLAIQPSELGKIVAILFWALVLNKLQLKGKREINKIWKLFLFQ